MYCAVCATAYDYDEPDAQEMVECERCNLWVHPQCDGIALEALRPRVRISPSKKSEVRDLADHRKAPSHRIEGELRACCEVPDGSVPLIGVGLVVVGREQADFFAVGLDVGDPVECGALLGGEAVPFLDAVDGDA